MSQASVASAVLERLRSGLADRYSIERQVGVGGTAYVYLAVDLKHKREVALKVLLPELATTVSASRFLREIELAAKLTHPRILPLHDSGEVNGLVFYVMPYVEGESLRDRLGREHRLPRDEAMRIAREVASALDYAHGRGVVHRDIKPENILLIGGETIIMDFGIGRAISVAEGSGITQAGMTVGTPMYMSPEQCVGNPVLDGRSDLYSLACVTYEMLAGRPPFTGTNSQEILARHLMDEVPRLIAACPDIPPAVEQSLVRALAKKPDQRFASALEFVRAMLGEIPLPPLPTPSSKAATTRPTEPSLTRAKERSLWSRLFHRGGK
jgi:serine/threonine protein kinase